MTKQKKHLQKTPKNSFKFNIIWVYAAIAIIFFGLQMLNFDATKQTSWQEFNREMLQQQKVEKVVIVNKEIAKIYIKREYLDEEKFRDANKEPFGNSTNNGPHFYFEIGSVETFNQQLNEAQTDFDNYDKISVTYKTEKDIFGDILGWILPLVFFIAIWFFIMKRMQGVGGQNGIFSFAKSRAKIISPDKPTTAFKDVAGCDEAKVELQEIVEFLKYPAKYKKLGCYSW